MTMECIRWISVLWFIVCFESILTDNGRPCFLGFYQRGVCTTQRKCYGSSRRGIVSDNDANSCGFRNGKPLVCCPQNFNSYYQHPSYYNYFDSSEEDWDVSNRQRDRPNWHLNNRPGRRRRPQKNRKNDNDAVTICEARCAEYYELENPTPEKVVEPGVFRPFVVGGINANDHEFPHMVALGFGDKGAERWLCGGSLISERYVVTAAHCITSQGIGDVKWARMGVSNLKTIDPEKVQDFGIEERIKHPEYKTPLQYNDIGLLKTDKDVTFNDHVRPICLQTDVDLADTIPIATGWGRTQYGGVTSDDLKKVDISYFTIEQCQEVYKDVAPRRIPKGIVDETQICAGGVNEEKDTCQGDSGGPLQIKNSKFAKAYNLIGITSFGMGCGIINSPGVYTRVSYYIPWIQKIVWPQSK